MAESRVVKWVRARTPRDGRATAVADSIGRTIEKLGLDEVAGVGIASAGLIDASGGRVLSAPNIPGFDEPVPLLELVRARIAAHRPNGATVPMVLGNDVNALARAEFSVGAAVGDSDALVMALGTGVGGALILDGRVRSGPRGFSGEIGHVIVQPGGRRCSCGGHGHLEAYVGRSALEREARDRHGRGRSTLLVDLAGDRRISSSTWDQALAAGDEVAVTLRLEAAGALAVAISQAATLLDLELVVLGGGFAPIMGRPFRVEVERQLTSIAPLGAPELRLAQLGDQSGAIGAALLMA